MRFALAFVLIGLALHPGGRSVGTLSPVTEPGVAPSAKALDAVEGTPLVFVENRGQVPARYRFQSVGFGQTALFADSHVVLSRNTGRSFVVTWDGAQPTRPEPGPRSESRHSFLHGKDGDSWQRGVHGRSSVVYRAKYEGVDLHFSGDDGNLKSTYYVAPGIDPLDIRWRYVADALLDTRIDESGDLVVIDPEGGAVVTEKAPIAWQTVNGVRREVSVRYALFGDGSVGFELGAYDPARELVIDPDIEWATFLGGNGTDHINDLDVDGHGMVYLAGYAHSKYCDETIPLLAGDGSAPLQWWYGGEIGDAIVVKIDPNGRPANDPCPQVSGRVPRLVYSTRLGGGRTYVCNSALWCSTPVNTGTCCPVWMNDPATWNPNCPPSSVTTALGYGPLGVGVPSYQWYMGALPTSLYYPYPTPHPSLTCSSNGAPLATRPRGGDVGFGIAVDSNGEVVVVGRTESDDFPGTGSAVSPNPALIPARQPSWQPALGSNYVGANCGPGTVPPYSDAFVVRLNAMGTELVFSTYFGGPEHEQALAVDLDRAGNAYVVGYIESAASIVPPNWLGCPTPNGAGDGFILKFDPTGLFAGGRYLGGTDWDVAIDLDVGPNPDDPTQDRVFVTGTTRSADFVALTSVDTSCNPIPLCTTSTIQSTYSGFVNNLHDFFFDSRMDNRYGDGWVARYSLDLVTLENFTYFDACSLGGTPVCGAGASDEWIEAIAVDSAGIAWIAGVLGFSQPQFISPATCGMPFQRAMGSLAGIALRCGPGSYVQAATVIVGDHVVHPFDIAVDQNRVYVAGSVGRLKLGSPLVPSLATVNPLSGYWLYDHRDCNGNMSTRLFDFQSIQADGTCTYNCATFDGFVGTFLKSATMPTEFLSYLGGEGVELLHAIAPLGDGFVVGGAAGKNCSMAPRKNWLCEPALYNASEIDVPGAPGHCGQGGGYGPAGNWDQFKNIYQGSRYAGGSAEAYLVYIRP